MDNSITTDSTKIADIPNLVLTKGIVLLLDLLGTKEIYKNVSYLEKINKEYDELINYVRTKHETQRYRFRVDGVEIVLVPKIRLFSDTILIIFDETEILKQNPDFTKLNPLTSIMVSYCGKVVALFNKFLQENLCLRGVISYGDIFVGENLIIGPAIDEAQEWYGIGDWIGVFLTPCAYFEYRNFFKRHKGIDISNFKNDGKTNIHDVVDFDLYRDIGLDFTINYSVPLKNNTKLETRAINWPADLKDDKFSNGKTLWEVFSQRPIFPSFYSKYKNTLDFYHYALKKNREDEAEE